MFWLELCTLLTHLETGGFSCWFAFGLVGFCFKSFSWVLNCCSKEEKIIKTPQTQYTPPQAPILPSCLDEGVISFCPFVLLLDLLDGLEWLYVSLCMYI